MMAYDVLRIFLAGLLGLIMGRLSSRGQVSRTFAIVALGSALVAIISTELFRTLDYPWSSDPGRLSAQVVAAMGFIGTGLIWTSENGQVRGLSASASLWLTAIMGLLVGSGLKHISTAAAFAVLMIYWLSGLIFKKRGNDQDD